MNFKERFSKERARRQVIVEGLLVPEYSRCVQCGVCSYYCPIGIDIRRHVWTNKPINDSHCLTCGECVARCPRGVLRFEKSNLFSISNSEIQSADRFTKLLGIKDA